MSAHIADLIDGLEFFKDFSYPELKLLSGYFGQMQIDKDKVVSNEGDPGSYMLTLIEGKISIHKTGESGRHLLSTNTH